MIHHDSTLYLDIDGVANDAQWYRLTLHRQDWTTISGGSKSSPPASPTDSKN